MKLEMITEGLLQLLKENNYTSNTITFYEREWKRLRSFLMHEYGDSEFDMERGLLYLEKQYGIIGKYNDGTLSQQRVQLLRVIHMLEDYSLHQVLTRRYYAHKNPILLKADYDALCSGYADFIDNSELSVSTIHHYKRSATLFLDYLTQKKVSSVSDITMDTCNSYLKTFAGYTFKTVEQQVCGLRHFLRFLYSSGLVDECLADRLHMPAVSKSAKIPST